MPSASRARFSFLRGQHVLITGGSSGIGLALACQAAAAGARVSLVARGSERLAAAQSSVQQHAADSSPIFTAIADVSVQAEALAALKAAEAVHGPIDVLVASAGIARPGYFEEIPIEVFERTMAVNYFGTLYPLKAVISAMRQRRAGRVVVISSGAGLYGFFGYTAYAPSKFALRGLAEALRAELNGSGVRLSVVYPPDTATPQLEEENRTKPPETRAITAGGGLWTAEAVATAIWAGVEQRRFAITPGLPVTALAWLHSLAAPLLHWGFDRTARRARR